MARPPTEIVRDSEEEQKGTEGLRFNPSVPFFCGIPRGSSTTLRASEL